MRLGWIGLAVAAALAACSLPVVDKQADAIARQLYEEVRTGADISQDPHVANELKNPTTQMQLSAFRAMIPPGPPSKIETRSWNFNSNGTGTTTNLVLAYKYPDRTILANVALFKAPGGQSPNVVGFNLTQEPAG